jgi:hypothetical protein
VKPLGQRQKAFLYGNLVHGRLRPVAKPLYDAIIGGELAAHRLVDSFRRPEQGGVERLTAVIKTFERPYAVRRLVRSIRRRYPGLAVLVVDDSRHPVPLDGVEQLVLPYDSGISEGRNRALERVATPYFLLLDDDFVFSHHQRLGEWVAMMDRNPAIDILGGRCIDLPFYIHHPFQDTPLHRTRAAPKTPLGTLYEGHPVVDKVQNYFVGRTASVRRVKWNPALKVFEHTDFFTRARGRLTTVLHRDMWILHAKTPFDVSYARLRYRMNPGGTPTG